MSETVDDKNNTYESGTYKIWTENAEDVDTHGTTIVLNKIRPQTKETLSSLSIWEGLATSKADADNLEIEDIKRPKYHIGLLKDNEHLQLLADDDKVRTLPWQDSDSPEEAFKKLVMCVWEESKPTNPNPKITDLFDYYLKMIWDLALSIPTDYVEKDIFELPYDDQFYAYKISNVFKGGQASEINIQKGESLKAYLDLQHEKKTDCFNVYIDKVKLSRPVIFENLPYTANAITKPMVFIGDFEEKFENYSDSVTGGPLKFKAYLIWNSKICPTEHQGSLIRIHNASGTLYDDSFMKYQVQENTRKKQVTCEIFVEQGLDSALNIDRESYNFSHPHVVILTKWLHSAFRQLTNANKQLAKKLRENNRENKSSEIKSQISNIVENAWARSDKDIATIPPKIEIIETEEQKATVDNRNSYIVDFTGIKSDISITKNFRERRKATLSDDKIKAITSILASYGVLESLSPNKRNAMIHAIYEVIIAEGEL